MTWWIYHVENDAVIIVNEMWSYLWVNILRHFIILISTCTLNGGGKWWNVLCAVKLSHREKFFNSHLVCIYSVCIAWNNGEIHVRLMLFLGIIFLRFLKIFEICNYFYKINISGRITLRNYQKKSSVIIYGTFSNLSIKLILKVLNICNMYCLIQLAFLI